MRRAPSPMPLADVVADLARRMAGAGDIDALATMAPEIRGLAIDLVDLDAGAGLVTRVMSALNDGLTRRIMELAAARHRLPAAGWCWLTMGSEGRGEQTFVTDQDNGLVFSAADDAEARALRPLFLEMAREVNDSLAACGIPLCKGGIMAGNERWCLSIDEWQRHFSTWMLMPEPQALLNATIFFDFRAQHGDESLAMVLRRHLQRVAPQAAGFLHMMAANALAVAPPLGRLRDFVSEDGLQGRIDLKKHGSRLFVDAARVLALSVGTEPVGTVERLEKSAVATRHNLQDVAAAILAFRHLQRVRLLDQHRKLAAGQVPDNLLDPDTLNPLDRRFLVESLKQARRLQQSLRQRYRLEGL